MNRRSFIGRSLAAFFSFLGLGTVAKAVEHKPERLNVPIITSSFDLFPELPAGWQRIEYHCQHTVDKDMCHVVKIQGFDARTVLPLREDRTDEEIIAHRNKWMRPKTIRWNNVLYRYDAASYGLNFAGPAHLRWSLEIKELRIGAK